MTKLLPCPFCKGKAFAVDGCTTWRPRTWCEKCGASIYTDTLEEAIAAWNRRVGSDE